MIWSQMQQAVFSFIAESSDSAIISAVAGSGKTTTLVEGVKHLPDPDYIFLAFNKNIAEELKSRGVRASTFHALCFGELNSRLSKRPKVDGQKILGIFQTVVPEHERDDYYDVIRLVSAAKNSACTPDDGNCDWETLIDHYELFFPSNDHAILLASRILTISNQRLDVIDFDDMLYIPWLKNFSLRTYKTVFIDEAQDTNQLQLALLQRLVDPFSGRIIAVGDQQQAIYGFRGAGTGSMSTIQELFHCTELPLSVSYRCAREIVREAQQYSPSIQSHEKADDGVVVKLESYSLPGFSSGSAIICRVNRPLISLAYRCIKAGIPLNYLGRDIASQFTKLLKKHSRKGESLEALYTRLEAARDQEVAEAERKGHFRKVGVIEDRYDSIISIINSLPANAEQSEVAEVLRKIFTPSAGGLTLTTVHKAKGLEWPVVYLLDSAKYMPHPRATEGWQLQQEYNMLYVAVTRAKRELYFIES